ncbi:MAG: hypothetical protein E5W03_06560, partial [Mesorhizobium sp.]
MLLTSVLPGAMFICLSLFFIGRRSAERYDLWLSAKSASFWPLWSSQNWITFAPKAVYARLSIPLSHNLVLPDKSMRASFGRLVQRTEISKPSHDAPNPSLAKPLPRAIITRLARLLRREEGSLNDVRIDDFTPRPAGRFGAAAGLDRAADHR